MWRLVAGHDRIAGPGGAGCGPAGTGAPAISGVGRESSRSVETFLYARFGAARCRADSYSTMDAAVAAFSELAVPDMGIRTRWSQASRQAELSPVVSFPINTRVGWVKSYCAASSSPFSSVPTRRTSMPRARVASVQSRTGRWEGTRTAGSENSEPVLARTDLGSYRS